MTTRIRLLSDLHLEFHADGGKEFVSRLPKKDVDLVIIPGDISNAAGIESALDLLAEHFAPLAVLFVLGNHEFYGGRRHEVLASVDRALKRHDNLMPPHRGVFDLTGVHDDGGVTAALRIVSCSLWFEKPGADAPKHALNDFQQIADFESWVYTEGDKDAAFLGREVKPGDIVVTHYLPCPEAVAPRWRGNPLNCFFMRDMTALIAERKPALWLFGHTHDSIDTVIDRTGTRIVCNPFGYKNYEENPRFNPTLTIEL